MRCGHHGDIEAISPGWHARHYKDWPDDPGGGRRQARTPCAERSRARRLSARTSARYCAARITGTASSGRCRCCRSRSEYLIPSLAAVLGSTPRPDFEFPKGSIRLLTLALGLRAGYPAKPPLPLGREAEGVTERLPTPVCHGTCCRPGRTVPSPGSRPDDGLGPHATGLVQIGKSGRLARPVAVIGSTAEDFALAVALDRMYGATIWVPVEWTQDSGLQWLLQKATATCSTRPALPAPSDRHEHFTVRRSSWTRRSRQAGRCPSTAGMTAASR